MYELAWYSAVITYASELQVVCYYRNIPRKLVFLNSIITAQALAIKQAGLFRWAI